MNTPLKNCTWVSSKSGPPTRRRRRTPSVPRSHGFAAEKKVLLRKEKKMSFHSLQDPPPSLTFWRNPIHLSLYNLLHLKKHCTKPSISHFLHAHLISSFSLLSLSASPSVPLLISCCRRSRSFVASSPSRSNRAFKVLRFPTCQTFFQLFENSRSYFASSSTLFLSASFSASSFSLISSQSRARFDFRAS